MNLEDASILVVDDETMLCKIFAGWLQRAGCRRVRTANDGAEALAAIQAEPAHLLITDVRMPRMDGVTLVRRLEAIETPVPSILFVSGFCDVNLEEMYALGVQDFLSKPVGRVEFVERVRLALMERSELLAHPMKDAPRQSLEVDEAVLVPGPACLTETPAACAHQVCLGSGGLTITYPGVLTIGKVAFRCRFPAENFELCGHGHVRWHNRAQRAYGIELAFLAEPGLSFYLAHPQSRRGRSFIPSPPAISSGRVVHPSRSGVLVPSFSI